MKKNHLLIILIAFVTLLLGCGDALYQCKITGKVYFIDEMNVVYIVPDIDVTLTPKNEKMQYYSTVKTDKDGMYQFDGAYKDIQYKLTVSVNLKDIGNCYGETEYFTVSKDQLIQKDIYLQKIDNPINH